MDVCDSHGCGVLRGSCRSSSRNCKGKRSRRSVCGLVGPTKGCDSGRGDAICTAVRLDGRRWSEWFRMLRVGCLWLVCLDDEIRLPGLSGYLGDRRFEGLGGPRTSRIDCDKPLGWMSCRVARSQVAGRRSQLEVCGSQRTDLVLKKRLVCSQVLVPWGGLGLVCGITMSLLRRPRWDWPSILRVGVVELKENGDLGLLVLAD